MKHDLRILSLSIEQDCPKPVKDPSTYPFHIVLKVAVVDWGTAKLVPAGMEAPQVVLGKSTVSIDIQLRTLPATTPEEWLNWARAYLAARFVAPVTETPSVEG